MFKPGAVRLVLACSFVAAAAAATADNPVAAPPPPLTVMSFNLRLGVIPDGVNAWPHRHPFIAEVIRREDPDVIGAQEALNFMLLDLVKELPEYRVLGKNIDSDFLGEEVAILYRADRLKALAAGMQSLSDTPAKRGSKTWDNEHQRQVQWAKFEQTATSRRFVFYNTHLDNVGPVSKERGARQIRDLVLAQQEAGPAILTGDFNCGADSPAHGLLTGRIAEAGHTGNFRDAWLEVHKAEPPQGTYHAFTGVSHGARIDFVLEQPGLRAVRAEILQDHKGRVYLSDHFVILAQLAWEE